MLELKGENPFKVKAYENGARAILTFPGDISEAIATRELLRVPGIGTGLFAGIETLVKTGTLPLYDELRAAYPPALRECLRIPGFGARKARLVFDTLGVDSVDALERACREGRLAQVKGFGAKTAERILRGIEVLRTSRGWHLARRARARAQEAVAALEETGAATRLAIAGSLRRRKEIVRDVDLLAASERPEDLSRALATLGVSDVIAAGGTKTSVRLDDGLAVDLRVVGEENWPAALLYFTGSEEHNTQLRGRARRRNLKLNEYGLFDGESGARIPASTEGELYRALGLSEIEPELREGRGEIDAAERGELPRLVEERDLLGLIHVHTTESDGRDPLETMVEAARTAGYRYAAITDHSESAGYAGGLTRDRVLRQREEIRALQSRLPDFRIFHGTEADILADGSIDFGDEFLEGFDLVVASVHSRFGLDRETQTRRLIRAVRNPRVSVLGHPTGRLLLSRDPIEADLEAVIDAAAESGCAIEVNGSPHRLELDWRFCRRAVERGVRLALDSDAHSVGELGYVSEAVAIARKGWATAEAVLNALSADELAAWLERRRGAPLRG